MLSTKTDDFCAISFSVNMRSLASVAGCYFKLELHTWCLWIAVDHTYNHISSIMGLHKLHCTVFPANIISTLDISGSN